MISEIFRNLGGKYDQNENVEVVLFSTDNEIPKGLFGFEGR